MKILFQKWNTENKRYWNLILWCVDTVTFLSLVCHKHAGIEIWNIVYLMITNNDAVRYYPGFLFMWNTHCHNPKSEQIFVMIKTIFSNGHIFIVLYLCWLGAESFLLLVAVWSYSVNSLEMLLKTMSLIVESCQWWVNHYHDTFMPYYILVNWYLVIISLYNALILFLVIKSSAGYILSFMNSDQGGFFPVKIII